MSNFLHRYKLKLNILSVNCNWYVFATKCGNPGLCARNEVPTAPSKMLHKNSSLVKMVKSVRICRAKNWNTLNTFWKQIKVVVSIVFYAVPKSPKIPEFYFQKSQDRDSSPIPGSRDFSGSRWTLLVMPESAGSKDFPKKWKIILFYDKISHSIPMSDKGALWDRCWKK